MGFVDAGEALDELIRLAGEVEQAAILDDSGALLAATAATDGDRLARTAMELLDVAAVVDPARAVERVVVELSTGAVFVVAAAGRVVVVRTGPEPTRPLVLHDLRSCLERIDLQPAKRRGRKADPVDA